MIYSYGLYRYGPDIDKAYVALAPTLRPVLYICHSPYIETCSDKCSIELGPAQLWPVYTHARQATSKIFWADMYPDMCVRVL